MCSVESVRRVIRVKRKANEEKNVSHKRCKYIGSCHTNDDKDVHQLLVSSETLSQQQIQQQVDTLMITDCEEFLPFHCNQDLDHKINSLKHNQSIYYSIFT